MRDLVELFTNEVYTRILDQEGAMTAQCIEYLVATETIITDPETGQQRYLNRHEIAERLGISYTLLARRRLMWMHDGTLNKARKLLNMLKMEAIQVQVGRVLEAWPQIIERITDIALRDANPRTALAAAQWLHENVVAGNLGEQVDGGVEEAEFVKRRSNLIITADTIIGRVSPPGE